MSRLELIRVNPGVNGSAWVSGMEALIPGISVESGGDPLSGEMLAFDFAGARLWKVSSQTQLVKRRRPCPGGRFQPMAMIQLEGMTRVTQFDQTQELCSNNFRFIDAAKPMVLEQNGRVRLLYVQFPPSLFTAGVYQLATCQSQIPEWPIDKNFVDCAIELWNCAENLMPREHATALGALMSLATLTSPFRKAEEENAVPVRVKRAMEFIEHNLSESWLTPVAVAEAQHVSRRYLDDLFMQLGFRVEGWIWERRLLRATEELRLYGQFKGSTKKTILMVALDLGFKNPSHFTKMFSSRFGVTPRDYRARLSDQSPDLSSESFELRLRGLPLRVNSSGPYDA